MYKEVDFEQNDFLFFIVCERAGDGERLDFPLNFGLLKIIVRV